MQYDVFISYARKDYADEQTKEVIPDNIVSRIRQLFDDNDITYWFDETGIYSGDQFVGVIADAIEQSSIFLYISTEASNASKWTINEIATAKHLDKKIIPFRYDGAKYNNAILMCQEGACSFTVRDDVLLRSTCYCNRGDKIQLWTQPMSSCHSHIDRFADIPNWRRRSFKPSSPMHIHCFMNPIWILYSSCYGLKMLGEFSSLD